MTESGGTTGTSFFMRDSSGWRIWSSNERDGLVIIASTVNDQKKVLEECSVKAWRRAGIRDQDEGAGSTRFEYVETFV